jgi:hypothetical protein
MALEQLNAPPSTDSDASASKYSSPDSRLVNAVANAHKAAGVSKEPEQVNREIAELIREIAVATSAVDEHTAIRADAAADKGPRRCLEVSELPVLEGNTSKMLLSQAMLREETRQVARVHPQDRGVAAIGMLLSDRILREGSMQELAGRGHDARVLGVQRDAQPMSSGHLRDASISQIKGEKLHVVSFREANGSRRSPAARAIQ